MVHDSADSKIWLINLVRYLEICTEKKPVKLTEDGIVTDDHLLIRTEVVSLVFNIPNEVQWSDVLKWYKCTLLSLPLLFNNFNHQWSVSFKCFMNLEIFCRKHLGNSQSWMRTLLAVLEKILTFSFNSDRQEKWRIYCYSNLLHPRETLIEFTRVVRKETLKHITVLANLYKKLYVRL